MAVINPELLDIARQAIKQAFVPSDTTMEATGAPPGPGEDPAMGGPSPGAGPVAGSQPDTNDPMVQAALQAMLQQQGGGVPAEAAPPAPAPTPEATADPETNTIPITIPQLTQLLQAVSGKSGSTEDLKRLKAENAQLKSMLGMPADAVTPEPADGGTGGSAAPAGMNMGHAAPETLPLTALTPNGPIPKQSSVDIAKIAASLRKLS